MTKREEFELTLDTYGTQVALFNLSKGLEKVSELNEQIEVARAKVMSLWDEMDKENQELRLALHDETEGISSATLDKVLRWLRSESDSTQLRAIIASVEDMRSNAEITGSEAVRVD